VRRNATLILKILSNYFNNKTVPKYAIIFCSMLVVVLSLQYGCLDRRSESNIGGDPNSEGSALTNSIPLHSPAVMRGPIIRRMRDGEPLNVSFEDIREFLKAKGFSESEIHPDGWSGGDLDEDGLAAITKEVREVSDEVSFNSWECICATNRGVSVAICSLSVEGQTTGFALIKFYEERWMKGCDFLISW
jgi:hypothetical protein